MKKISACVLLMLILPAGIGVIPGAITQKLIVGPHSRYLVKENGDAFVWIGATLWWWDKLTLAQMKRIIDDQHARGYTLLSTVAYADRYPTLDSLVDYACGKDTYLALNCFWHQEIFSKTETELYEHGFEIGSRYKDKKNIIWLTAGEAGGYNRRSTTIPDQKLAALVKGIREGDTGDKLLTIHADYQRGTSQDNDADLVDFNNWQSSQWCCPTGLPRNGNRNWTVWEAIDHDYRLRPPKPTLDSEARYENNKDFCGADAYVIRRRAYYAILAGGFGHTYGAGGIWDGLLEKDGCSGTWEEALSYAGYHDIGHLSTWMHSLGNDLLKMGPDQSIIVEGQSEDYDHHIQAAIAGDGSFAAVYSGDNDPYALDLRKMAPPVIKAQWFDPNWGTWLVDPRSPYSNISQYQVFDPPDHNPDWLLFLTDTSGTTSIRTTANSGSNQYRANGSFRLHVPFGGDPDAMPGPAWNISGRMVSPGVARPYFSRITINRVRPE